MVIDIQSGDYLIDDGGSVYILSGDRKMVAWNDGRAKLLLAVGDGEKLVFSCSKERPVKVIRMKRTNDTVARLISEGQWSIEEAPEYPHDVIWEAASIIKTMKLGTVEAKVVDGKFTVQDYRGDLEDAKRLFGYLNQHLFEPPEIKAYDVIGLENGTHMYAVPFPDEPLAFVRCKVHHGRIVSSGSWDTSADIYWPDYKAVTLLRHKNPCYAFDFIHNRDSGCKIIDFDVVWTRPSLEPLGYWNVSVEGNELQVGCQTVTYEQLRNLVDALNESIVAKETTNASVHPVREEDNERTRTK